MMINPRNVVRLGRGARLRLVETPRRAGRRARPRQPRDPGRPRRRCRARARPAAARRARAAASIGKTHYRRLRRARVWPRSLATLGGGLVRNETRRVLDGSGDRGLLNGLYMPRGREHVDNADPDRTTPHPGSHRDQFYKGVVDGRATPCSPARSSSSATRRRPTPTRPTTTCCCRTRPRSTPSPSSRSTPTT